jgi:hypothetical protein
MHRPESALSSGFATFQPLRSRAIFMLLLATAALGYCFPGAKVLIAALVLQGVTALDQTSDEAADAAKEFKQCLADRVATPRLQLLPTYQHRWAGNDELKAAGVTDSLRVSDLGLLSSFVIPLPAHQSRNAVSRCSVYRFPA